MAPPLRTNRIGRPSRRGSYAVNNDRSSIIVAFMNGMWPELDVVEGPADLNSGDSGGREGNGVEQHDRAHLRPRIGSQARIVEAQHGSPGPVAADLPGPHADLVTDD